MSASYGCIRIPAGFLQNPEVRRWLNGVEPAWTMLEFNSLNALRREPSTSNHAIRLEPDLTNTQISGSAVTSNALILLRRAAKAGGLKLTATGNLSRAVVEEMCGIIRAPGYDKTELLRVQKGHKRARCPSPPFRSHSDASCEALPDVPWKAGTDTLG